MALCPNCGEENPDRARLCMMCGTALNAAPAPQAEERKVVSVLFVDLVGFTARSHDADPEDVRAALAPYHRLLKTEIERFGGTVEKFIGDAVMAVFGAPVAHEDDAERAVRAALRITEAIEELNESTPNLDLSIRAAVNTGEGLVTLGVRPQAGEGMVTGDVVNTASRLQGIAPVGGVAVGEITYRSTKDFISYESLDQVIVKGKPEPISVWRAVSARSRFGVDVDMASKTPFIGRDFDLGALKNAYQRTLREASVQLVTITGEPGVGKTRLLAEFSSFIDDQDELVYWRQGRSLPYGEGITFWALGEIIKAQAGILELDSPETATQKLHVAVDAVIEETDERAWFLARLGPLVGAKASQSGSAEKEESFTAWRRFLEAIAARGPLVLVFEDLHWADATMLEFIDHLVEWSTGVPLLVVCTARPELYESHQGWGGGKRNSNTISLSPLSDSETAQLISALLSQAVLPADVHAALLERAGGNPLYAEEFIRMLSDRGILQAKGRVLSIDPDADIPIPDNVQALIAARLDTLSPERKSLLHDAAVVGKVFWSGALATVGELDEEFTRRSLQELVRKELIRPARTSSIEGSQEYSFFHTLIRDVAYGEIPRSQRAVKHQGVARWLEAVSGDRVGDHAEVLAHHYETALELLSASGVDDRAADVRNAAIRFLLLAAERAETLDPAAAQRHYETAFDLTPRDDARRAKVLLGLAKVVQFSGEYEEAASLAEEALRQAQQASDRRSEGMALLRAATIQWWMGDSTHVQDIVFRAIAILEPVGPGPELATAYLHAAENAITAGLPAESATWADRALAMAEQSGLPGLAVEARANKAWARCELGESEALEAFRAAYRDAVVLGNGDQIARIGSALSDWLWWIEGPASALEILEEATARSERRGLIHLAMHGRAGILWPLYDLGDWDRLLADGREIVRSSENRNNDAIAAIAMPYIAQVLLWRQRHDEASVVCERLLPLARNVQDLQVLAPSLAVCAHAAWARRNRKATVDLVEELDEATRHSGPWRSRHLLAALRVLIAAGKLEKAENFIGGIEVTATRDVNCVLTGRAILAEGRSNTEEARNLYQEAAQRWADYGFLLEEGQAHLGLARCLIALGDREAATEPLQKAQAIFERLGAVPLLNEVDGYLGDMQASG